MSRAFLLLCWALTGCSAISLTVHTASTCSGIHNDAQADCSDVADNVRIASQMFGQGAAEVLAHSQITIVNARRLYVNADGGEVAGTTQCVEGHPVITLDRSTIGLLHELFHASDCLAGLPAGHDWSPERERLALAFMTRVLPPRRLWTSEEAATERFQRQARASFERTAGGGK